MSRQPRKRIPPLVLVLAVTALVIWASWVMAEVMEGPIAQPQVSSNAVAIASLAPAVTESLFAIGAGADVVAVSRFCDFPTEVSALPHVGTGLTPNYEAIANLAPTLIITDRYAAVKQPQLARIAPTIPLPWLTLDEATASIRRLGRITHRESEAAKLAARMRSRLAVAAPPHAPRVLLTYGISASKLAQVWFIQRNSLHGAALRAAGGRNAVARDIQGTARMSVEQLLQIDPDMIIVLEYHRQEVRHREPSTRAPFHFVTALRAVHERRTGVIRGPSVHSIGPRILDLVDRLAQEIRALGAATQ